MKYIVIHHNDRDGRVSAAIGVEYWIKKLGYPIDDIVFVETDYSKTISQIIREVSYDDPAKTMFLIVDVSITSFEDFDYIDLKNSDTIGGAPKVWIDHHESSFNKLAEYKKTNKNWSCHGIRCNGISAAALAYIYFNFDRAKVAIKNDPISRFLSEYVDTGKNMAPNEIDTLFDIFNVPEYIRYVSKYDTFQSTDDDVFQFNYGDILRDVDYYCNLIKSGNVHKEYVAECIERGKIIKEYVDNKSASNIKNNSFEVFTSFAGRELKGLAVNDSTFSSLIFGDVINKYDFVMVFQYSGSGYRYSLYTTKSNVYCNKIAESFGGGGHQKAAGFGSSKLIFNKQNRF